MINGFSELEFVTSPSRDWIGLYCNRKLVFQSRAISAEDCLDALGIPFRESTASKEWLEQVGKFPNDIEDIFYSLD